VRIGTRERIDIEGEPRKSYLHKIFLSDTSDEVIEEEFYSLTLHGVETEHRDITRVEWDEVVASHPPQPTYPNSEWGDGLPEAGDIWAGIPAAERK